MEDNNISIKRNVLFRNIRFVMWLALMAACMVYGLVVRAVASGTAFFAVWLAMGIGFGLLAVCNKLNIWVKLPRIVRIILISVVSVGIIIFGTIEVLIISAFGGKSEDNLDYIIVLGAQVYESGPSAILSYRLDSAIDYLNDNPETLCIVSGGQGYNEPRTEAEVMYDYLVENGIDEGRIIKEDKSTNTIENILFSKDVADLSGKTVAVVTNNFHVFRATAIARKQGIEDCRGIPAHTVRTYLPNNMFREFFGVVKDVLQGNMLIGFIENMER